jgi:hypothetical protein
MAAGKSVDSILSDAKAAVQHAEETSRLNSPAPVPVPEGLRPPPSAPKSAQHQAPYSLAHTLRSHKSDVDKALNEIGK